ncbi:MAG TPA: extracellular solute-binding protein [Anaerolineae bacterium]|nr:extracellular solute-binding protein [Anaerolineae bacterium]
MSGQADIRLLTLTSILVILGSLLFVALVGCSVAPSPTPRSADAEATPTPAATAISETTPSPTPTLVEPRPSHITLTVWGPVQFSPGEANAGSSTLQGQYEAFEAVNEDTGVEYLTKAPYGESGVLDLLLAAGYAAPTVLPDLAIVDTLELDSLAREGLAQPINDLITDEFRAGLFPFATEACTFEGELRGIQFEADIEHLIYYTKALEEPPATWADLFSDPVSYTFPAGGEDGLVNDAFLIQYLAQGGEFTDEEGSPVLEDSPAQRVLRFYDALRIWDVSPTRVLELSDLEDSWAAYAEGNVTVSHISSWRYLTSRSVMQDTAFAPLPTETGTPATMARGWAFVIITESPYRQEAAARLIEWLMTPANLAQWSQASNHLPTQPSALQLTDWPLDYVKLLESLLADAFYRPSTPELERMGRALQIAVQDVLSGERTPRQATTQVMESLE